MVRELVKGCTAKGDEVSEKESARAEFLKGKLLCTSRRESSCFVPRGACNVPIYASRGVTLLTVCASSRRAHSCDFIIIVCVLSVLCVCSLFV
jgi:hypothetical protein